VWRRLIVWLAAFVLLIQQSYALLIAPLMDLSLPLAQAGWLPWVLLVLLLWGLAARE